VIHDAACFAALAPVAGAVERHGIFYTSAHWTPDALGALATHLDTTGRTALAAVPGRHLFDAWCTTVEMFSDPASAESEAIRPALARFTGLSAPGLAAALDAVLGGVARSSAKALFAAAQQAPATDSPASSLVAVFLASNLPALAVQSLLPALVLKRPILLKSPTQEPLFTPAFVRALCRIAPELEPAVAAVTWSGGNAALEGPILDRAQTVLAYGETASIASVASRTRGECVSYGPKASIAIVDADADPAGVACGLARDIALFDQRGCLSIQAVYTDGDAQTLAQALDLALAELAQRWPPGPLDPTAVAGVQQLRLDARLRGLYQSDQAIATGTVVVEPVPGFQPSPGLRSVRVHPSNLDRIVPLLASWRGRLQGAALAGEGAWALAPGLAELGVSRCAVPGQLQVPDALWHNGGIHPLEALGRGSSEGR